MKIIQGISASVREAEASLIERERKKLGLEVSVTDSEYRKSIAAVGHKIRIFLCDRNGG